MRPFRSKKTADMTTNMDASLNSTSEQFEAPNGQDGTNPKSRSNTNSKSSSSKQPQQQPQYQPPAQWHPPPFDPNELAIFRHGVGLPLPINPEGDIEAAIRPTNHAGLFAWVPFLHNSYGLNAAPPPEGLYGKVLAAECACAIQYYPCKFFINSSLVLQIFIAAALTAVGASGSSHTIVTVLGAINTVIAGLMALMKGHGLPNRLRQDMTQLRAVRDFIEDRECDFERWGEGWAHGDAKMAVAHARNMYEAVRITMENNRSDSYVVHKPNGDPDEDAPGPTL